MYEMTKHSPSSRRRFLRTAIGAALIPKLAFCAPASRPAGRFRSFYGVNADLVYDFEQPEYHRLAQFLTESGAGTLRMAIRWLVVEPQKGSWNWRPIDAALESLPRNIEPVAALLSTPTWSSGVEQGKSTGWFDTYPPRDLSDWSNFVRETVHRYRDRIGYWEIWNEENGIDFYHPNPDAGRYVELLKASYSAAKGADPRCKVLLGGLQMNGVIANPWSPVKTPNFLEDVYRAGGGVSFDICNTHPYVMPNEGAKHMIELTRDTRKVMAKYGDAEKPLWLTEMGCGLNNGITPADQAKLLSDCYEAAAADPGIDRLCWFTFRDLKQDILGPEGSMGMLTHSWQRKPAFEAFKRLATSAI
jgi:hypothetical protein